MMITLRQRLTILVLTAGIIVALDQATKYLVVHYLTSRVVIIPGLVDMVRVYNRGIAFGMFNSGQCLFRTTVLTILSVAVFVILFAAYLFSKDMTRLSMAALSLIMGGAVGNLIDRIRLGYVVDFIDAYIRSAHWPAFNVADSAITVGAILLAIDLLFSGHSKKQP